MWCRWWCQSLWWWCRCQSPVFLSLSIWLVFTLDDAFPLLLTETRQHHMTITSFFLSLSIWLLFTLDDAFLLLLTEKRQHHHDSWIIVYLKAFTSKWAPKGQHRWFFPSWLGTGRHWRFGVTVRNDHGKCIAALQRSLPSAPRLCMLRLEVAEQASV